MFDSVVCSHGVDRGNFTFLCFMQKKCVKYNNDSFFPSPALKPWQSFKYLEKTVTNRNCIHEIIKSRLYWRKFTCIQFRMCYFLPGVCDLDV
jgi:hypothetical protein